MKVRKILSRRSLTRNEDKDKRRERSHRMKSIPDADAGLVFWQDFCHNKSWSEIPTAANISTYVEEFVNLKEEKINRKRGLTRGDEGYRSGHDLFIKPVLRTLNDQSALVNPATVAHEHVNIRADNASQASRGTDYPNNQGLLIKLDADSVDPAEESNTEESNTEDSLRPSLAVTVSSLAVSASSKSLRSSRGKQAPPVATMASPLRQETILQLPSHDHGTTDGLSHPSDASATLNAGDMSDLNLRLIAQEFNMGLCRTSKVVKQHTMSRKANTVPLVLQEWRHGLQGNEAIQALNNKFGGGWKYRKDKYILETRRGVVETYIRLVMREGRSDKEAIEFLEQERAGRSITTLYKHLKKTATKTEKGRKSSVYGKDEPEYPKDLLYLAERVPRPPPIKETGFPLPVRQIYSISNIWKEWEIGWDGAPSIKREIEKHMMVWNNPDFKAYENHFRYRNQLVRTIHEAKKKNAVKSYEDAIRTLEDLRGTMEPSTFCKSKEFRSFLRNKWKITTAVKEWWKCGQYYR